MVQDLVTERSGAIGGSSSSRWLRVVSGLGFVLALWVPQGDIAWAKQDACAPYCGDAECGPDGCGGSCGECPEGTVCGALGICDIEGCTDACLLGSAGCEEAVAWTCEMAEDDCTVQILTDCAPMGATCQSGICVGGAAGLPGSPGSGSSGGAADAQSDDATAGGDSSGSAQSGGDTGCSAGQTAPMSVLAFLLLWLTTRRRAAPGL